MQGQTKSEDRVARWPLGKTLRFAAGTTLAGLLIGLALLEAALGLQAKRIAASEETDPGLIRYDETLGWSLAPGWSGAHRHYDFDVRYSVSPAGFRHDPALPAGARPRTLVLGDSFTFGTGVRDGETFVSRLNQMPAAGSPFLNLGVIGYSTDQQLLLLRRLRSLYRPEEVLLVVYLGNDLFDNRRPFPLQAENAKPYVRLDREGALVLENQPVPLARKPAGGGDLAEVVAGPRPTAAPLATRWFGGLELSRRLGLFQAPGGPTAQVLERRFEPEVQLFSALIRAMSAETALMGARLRVALLPGASWVARPESLSARYQDVLRARILATLSADVSVSDIATAMRASPAATVGELYFPHEGHLTPQGHEFVARVLAGRDRVAGDSP